MKKIRTAFLAIVLLAAAACSSGRPSAEAEAVRSVISVSFRQMDDTTFFFVRLYMRSPFDDMREVFPVMSGQSDFTTSCMLYFDQQVLLSVDDGQTFSIVLHPGDSVRMTLDAAALRRGETDRAATFSGDRAEENAQINAWTSHVYPQIYQTWNYNLSYKDFMAAFGQKLDGLRDELDRYARETGMSPKVKAWAARDLAFCLSNTLAGTPRGSTGILQADKLFQMTDDANFSSLMFTSHLDSYIAATMAEARKELGISAPPDLIVQAMVKKFAALPAGWVRDAVFYLFISAIIDGGNRDALYETVPDIERYISHATVRNLLPEVYRRFLYRTSSDVEMAKVVRQTSEGPVEITPDTLFFSYLSRQHPGRVIYLDVWTAWCEACGFERESAGVLREALGADTARVAFVDCCVASSYDEWLAALDTPTAGRTQYYLDQEAANALLAKYPVETYPVYFLIDGQGRLVSDHAPIPSHLDDALEAIRDLF
ncbi:MAG: hypothetical protein IJL64_02625 [Bacteroidales bacterium]|nr:hypothetical protein [Bacteroidales bacterium]